MTFRLGPGATMVFIVYNTNAYAMAKGYEPRLRETDYRVLLTLESRDLDYLGRALDSLLERLPDDYVSRVE